MTLNEIYLQGKKILKDAEIKTFSFDTMKIFEFCFNFDRQDIILYKNNVADVQKTQIFFKLINQRAKGRPLQYILGTWNFMDAEIKVGDGVLIPRDDTEVLVNTVLKRLTDIKKPKILDLCAGPGTISISLAQKLANAQIFAVELSEIAINYLKSNIKLNKVENVIPIKFDVLSEKPGFKFEYFDVIVSNPPYIPTADLETLQKEVRYEPKMALDGGADGLKFYRAITENWHEFLKKSGYLCVEIGFGQANDVIKMFNKAEFKNIEAIKDLNGIYRVILGQN